VKILVTAKRVPDPYATIKVRPDGSGIVTENLKYVVNAFDEIAIEEALRIKEKAAGTEVVLLSVGDKSSAEQLRTGLAMGADRAILVVTEQEVDPYVVAQVVRKVVDDQKPDLLVMGKQATDDDSNVVGQMVSEMLGWPQATFASKVELAGDMKSAVVTREVDGGLEDVEVPLPAVITTDLRLNEPRYASLPGIMKARKKELKEVPLASLGVDATSRVKVLSVEAPPERAAGKKVGSVEELVNLLHTEAKVI
jgi:electron transfer flavoprotein beta subunit